MDDLTAYGTLFELGVAFEKKKKIFIGIDKKLKPEINPICSCGNDFSDRPNEVGKGCCHSGPTTSPDELWFIKNSGESGYYENSKEAYKDFLDFVDPDSMHPSAAIMEPSLVGTEVGKQFQFLRKGYYCVDPESTQDKMVFNKTAGLKGAWKPKGK
jgi:hypothetical protein